MHNGSRFILVNSYQIGQHFPCKITCYIQYNSLILKALLILFINIDDISKLSVILEPVEDDWYHIGQCLEVKESVLTEIKEMKTVDSRLTYVLESWCIEEDRTLNELKDSLKRMDRDDILEGKHY